MKQAVLPTLQIGDLAINPPIIQGGMGVRVSGPSLASAVSREGALGVVAAVGTGEEDDYPGMNYKARSSLSLTKMIQDAMARANAPVAVNIMCALTNYAELVKAAEEAGVAAIISGAGLPLRLPGMVSDPSIKLIPIVSSGRAAELICATWSRKFQRVPDAIVVEGPLAGGHLGYDPSQLSGPEPVTVEDRVMEVLEVARSYGESNGRKIPVIAAGGVFSGKDIARFLRMGASGVQIGTRFVATHECDVSLAYKEAYVNSRKDDIVIIQSPLKLPLRVIQNDFVRRITSGDRVPFRCEYKCLATCDPMETKYCIAKALLNAYRGNMELGFATCGANAWRIDKIVSVKELIDELVEECAQELD